MNYFLQRPIALPPPPTSTAPESSTPPPKMPMDPVSLSAWIKIGATLFTTILTSTLEIHRHMMNWHLNALHEQDMAERRARDREAERRARMGGSGLIDIFTEFLRWALNVVKLVEIYDGFRNRRLRARQEREEKEKKVVQRWTSRMNDEYTKLIKDYLVGFCPRSIS
jgi:hypothetical protein